MGMTITDLEMARVPTAEMGRLAALRCAQGVAIALHQRELWLRWSPGDDRVPRVILPIRGCGLYGRTEGRWHLWGRALPAFDVPDGLAFRPLWQVIFPAPTSPLAPRDVCANPRKLTLVADGCFRRTTALQCPVERFLAWAESVPPTALAKYRGAIHGSRLFVVGANLPWIDDAERFWGRAVLVPIGHRPNPMLGEADLRRACGVDDSALLVLRADRAEVVDQDHFTSLGHASLRLASREAES